MLGWSEAGTPINASQASGDASGFGNSSFSNSNGVMTTPGRLAAVSATPGVFSTSCPAPMTPPAEQPMTIAPGNRERTSSTTE